MSIQKQLTDFKATLPENVQLIAVSKTKPNEAILEAYKVGHRIFGENKVQELVGKYESLPKDIEWHMIGHMQRNKVKYIAPFVSCIHGVDSIKLLEEINKRAAQNNRKISCLLQVHIAKESSKFGFSMEEISNIKITDLQNQYPHIIFSGLMGMATNVSDNSLIKKEFDGLNNVFNQIKKSNSDFQILSMGMSSDYQIAIASGSTHIRIGSAIFGSRNTA